jgi:2-amino-4-hydroxy-6-hydroxymethyldihydropteridine diphosphokinase
MFMKKVFLGIGSSLGSRESNLNDAVKNIAEFIGPVVASSSVYETEPWGFQSANQFLNIVAIVKTDLSPSELIDRILTIETKIGRIRNEEKYSSRVIDIDILFFDDLILDGKSLTIPHPKMHERKFVLVPLCEIAGEFVHPVLKKSMISLLKSCKDGSKVKNYSTPLSAKL